MSLSMIVLAAVLASGSALNTWQLPETSDLAGYVNVALDQDWIAFKKNYNRTYETGQEEMIRRIYWEDTLKFIREHNLRYDRGEETYIVGENDFADMAEDEFEKIYLKGLILPPEGEEEYPEALTEPDPEAPLELDWRTKGVVTPVKNQGRCGSCWAFSALGSLESVYKKNKGGAQKDLSEQELVDCAGRSYGNWACKGGWMANAYKYIKDKKGVDKESCYRYRGWQGSCRHKSSCIGARIKGYTNVGRSESSLQSSIYRQGPVAVAADVSGRGFMYYKRGVYYNRYCNGRRPNHAMVNVGYGVTGGRNYWIIKNSWSTSWGDRGYIFMAKGRGDTCGLAGHASYPQV